MPRILAPLFFASPAGGTYEIDDSGNITIRVVGGEIEVKSIVVRGVEASDASVSLDGADIAVTPVITDDGTKVTMLTAINLPPTSTLSIHLT